MKLQYVLAPPDVVAFNLYHADHSPAVRRNFWTQLVICLIVLFGITGYLSWQEQDPSSFFVSLAILPVYLLLFCWLWRHNMRRNVEKLIAEGKNKGTFGPYEIELASGQMIERSEGKMSSWKLDHVEKVVVTQTHLFLYTSALAACVVPRAFVDDEELDEFLAVLHAGAPDLSEKAAAATGITEFVRDRQRSPSTR